MVRPVIRTPVTDRTKADNHISGPIAKTGGDGLARQLSWRAIARKISRTHFSIMSGNKKYP
jgi:hypothetical protein